MNITEVKIKLSNNERLKAYCTIVLDNEFLIRDIKVIQSSKGYFVSMPSRKIADHCPKCGLKNAYTAYFCNNCGEELPEVDIPLDEKGREKLYADICHPIVPECREKIQKTVLEAFYQEKEKAEKEDSAESTVKKEEYEEEKYDGTSQNSFRDRGAVPQNGAVPSL